MLILLGCMFLIRATCLETLDLLDPTETRYATVAAEMVSENDWVTPQLPLPGGILPYLGKPPLHFWLTAVSYTLFGVDEWTTRLPSLLSLCAIAVLILIYARRFLSLESGVIGIGVMLSSAIMFFFAGASVVDVSLAAAVSLAAVALAHCLDAEGPTPLRWKVLLGLGVGFGALVKGPVVIALGAALVGILCILRRDFSLWKKIPWATAGVVALLVVVPWFILAELRNPGFLKYFLWNENIARYLFKDYGDRYGSGHRYPFGMSWIMLGLALLPWTPFLLIETWRGRRTKLSSAQSFLLAWGLSCSVFFSFVRQLHIGYVIPSIAPLSLLFADSILRAESLSLSGRVVQLCSAWIAKFGISVALIGLVFALLMQGTGQAEWVAPLFVAAVMALGCTVYARHFAGAMPSITRALAVVSSFLCFCYVIVLVGVAPALDRHGSTEDILNVIATSVPEAKPVIGVINENTFSHYWIALAGAEELSKPIVIEYLAPKEVGSVRHILVKNSELSRLPTGVRELYHERFRSGPWVWLQLAE